MAYDFKVLEKYLTTKEQNAVDRFFESGSTIDKVHTNEAGEKRRIIFLALPKGAKAPWTRYAVRLDSDGIKEKVYHTTFATSDEKVVNVLYIDINTEKKVSCTGAEWLKWLGEVALVEEPPAPPKTAADRLSANRVAGLAGGGIKKLNAKEYDALTSGESGKFRSPMNKKRS